MMQLGNSTNYIYGTPKGSYTNFSTDENRNKNNIRLSEYEHFKNKENNMDIKKGDYVRINQDSNGWQDQICSCDEVKDGIARLWSLSFPETHYNVTKGNRNRVEVIDIDKIGDNYKRRLGIK